MLRAEAHHENDMWDFLHGAARKAVNVSVDGTTLYDCVPAPIFRIAGRYRGQLLIQATSRGALRHFLAQWHPLLYEGKASAACWVIDVDPVEL